MVSWAERISIRKTKVDMPLLRARIEAATANAASIADTYGLLQAYLEELGDQHSSLYTPAQAKLLFSAKGKGFGFALIDGYLFPIPGGPSQVAGIRDRDRLVSVNGVPLEQLTSLRQVPDTTVFEVARDGVQGNLLITVSRGDIVTAQRPAVKALDNQLGFIELPGLTGTKEDETQFVLEGVNGIRTVDATKRCGWVLDLRRNSGGFPWNMLLAMAPLLGTGDIGGIIDGDNKIEKIAVAYSTSGATSAITLNGSPVAVANTGYKLSPDIPIAVLTSPGTASAGELAVVTLRGRSNVRVFGEKTFGVPSGNLGITLPDGSFVAVTSTYDVDRTGRVYGEALVPDEPSKTDWARFQTDADAQVLSASAWLRAQPQCVASAGVVSSPAVPSPAVPTPALPTSAVPSASDVPVG